MPYALLSLLWVSLVALFAAAASGLRLWGMEHHLQNHILAALTAAILALFAHTMTMFYFIGSAKQIKEYVAEWETATREEIRRRILVTKRKLFPHMTLVCLVLIVAFIMGGAYDAGVVGRKVHTYLVYGALVYHTHVCALETVHILRNIALIQYVNDLSRRRTVETPAR